MLDLRGLLTVLLAVATMSAASCSRAALEAPVAAVPNPALDAPLAKAPGRQEAVFAGGCFWGVEAVFEHVAGVASAVAGYSGGRAGDADYATVSRGRSGHAESVKVFFDPSKVSYGQLLQVFFSVAHDPTQLDRQGPDKGTQYRSAVFYANEEQHQIARAYVAQLDRAKVYSSRIVTQINPLSAFFPAEGYHQEYVARHPDDLYVVINDAPKLESLRARFPSLYRDVPATPSARN